MISITIAPQSAAHIDIMASAMKALLDSMTPPTAQVAEPAAMAKAIEHAEAVKEEKAKPPKPAKAARSTASAAPVDTQPASETATTQPEVAASPEPVSASPSKPLTLEEVRAQLAALSQAGKREEIKAAIASFGVETLTAVPADKYAELLAKVGA